MQVAIWACNLYFHITQSAQTCSDGWNILCDHPGVAYQDNIIGQLLISIVGFGALFELYSANFLMKHFWAVLIVLFALAFTISEFLAYLERQVSYYAAKR